MGSGGSVAAKAVGQTEEQLLEALKAYVRDKGTRQSVVYFKAGLCMSEAQAGY